MMIIIIIAKTILLAFPWAARGAAVACEGREDYYYYYYYY